MKIIETEIGIELLLEENEKLLIKNPKSKECIKINNQEDKLYIDDVLKKDIEKKIILKRILGNKTNNKAMKLSAYMNLHQFIYENNNEN